MKRQTPTPPNEWLFKDEGENRLFALQICLPDNTPYWDECTNAEKEAWEAEHTEPEPEEEIQDAEEINE